MLLTGCAAEPEIDADSTGPVSYVTVDATPSSRSAESTPTSAAITTGSATPVSSSAPAPTTPDLPSGEVTSETAAPSADAPSNDAPSTTAGPGFDPATLPDQPAPDPELPGDDSGGPCASDPNYFDEDPTGLDENVVTAWRAVEIAANSQGLVVCLNDGKRSRAQQQDTYDAYVAQYGQAMADQYVLTPDKSAHVTGYAIDVQPAAAFNWLENTNGAFGFCRTYDNEAWHFEFNRDYAATGCPARAPAPVR